MPQRYLALSLLAFVACGARAETCEEVPSVAASFDIGLMMPGTYELVLVATSRRERGAVAEGTLTLRPTTPSDRSPSTGQLAQDTNLADTPFYGWTDLDFPAVGAPVGSATASSRDPVFPGVLVRLVSWQRTYPRNTPVLLVSTGSNRRDNMLLEDGGGIGLWVRRLSAGSFAGEWSRWGLAVSGSGYFCATLVEP